jgi:hypothetical protein
VLNTFASYLFALPTWIFSYYIVSGISRQSIFITKKKKNQDISEKLVKEKEYPQDNKN